MPIFVFHDTNEEIAVVTADTLQAAEVIMDREAGLGTLSTFENTTRANVPIDDDKNEFTRKQLITPGDESSQRVLFVMDVSAL